MDILSFNRKKKKKMKVHDYRILHIQWILNNVHE
jgi:hypothetical protein